MEALEAKYELEEKLLSIVEKIDKYLTLKEDVRTYFVLKELSSLSVVLSKANLERSAFLDDAKLQYSKSHLVKAIVTSVRIIIFNEIDTAVSTSYKIKLVDILQRFLHMDDLDFLAERIVNIGFAKNIGKKSAAQKKISTTLKKYINNNLVFPVWNNSRMEVKNSCLISVADLLPENDTPSPNHELSTEMVEYFKKIIFQLPNEGFFIRLLNHDLIDVLLATLNYFYRNTKLILSKKYDGKYLVN